MKMKELYRSRLIEHGRDFEKILVIEITYARGGRIAIKHGGDNAKDGA